jgi:tubulin-folding cofactor B
MADVPLLITSENASSEKRITPSWSISQLRSKLEPVTGIPPSCQRLKLKTSTNEIVPIEAVDEDSTLLSSFPLSPYAELQVRYPYITFTAHGGTNQSNVSAESSHNYYFYDGS